MPDFIHPDSPVVVALSIIVGFIWLMAKAQEKGL